MAQELKASTPTVEALESHDGVVRVLHAAYPRPEEGERVTPCQLPMECSPEKKRAVEDAVGSKFERRSESRSQLRQTTASRG